MYSTNITVGSPVFPVFTIQNSVCRDKTLVFNEHALKCNNMKLMQQRATERLLYNKYTVVPINPTSNIHSDLIFILTLQKNAGDIMEINITAFIVTTNIITPQGSYIVTNGYC